MWMLCGRAYRRGDDGQRGIFRGRKTGLRRRRHFEEIAIFPFWEKSRYCDRKLY